jgi:hypothetical protein
MGERRNHAAAALLGVAGLCWVSTVIADGTHELAWGSSASVLLFAAGLLCVIGSLWAFGLSPVRRKHKAEQQAGVRVLVPKGRIPLTTPPPMQISDAEAARIAASRDPRFAEYRKMPEEKRKQPVSDAHRDLLKGVARKLRSYVDASQHAYYGAQGDERKAQAFEEHFADVAGRVTAWNEQVAALEAERRELQEWVEGCLRALAYDQPPFAWGYAGLIAEQAAGDGAELPFHVLQLEPLWLHLGPYPVAPDPSPNGRTREDIEDELRGVLSEARQQPQRERIRQIRGSLAEASEPLISDLDLIQAKDVINGLGDCLLCR